MPSSVFHSSQGDLTLIFAPLSEVLFSLFVLEVLHERYIIHPQFAYICDQTHQSLFGPLRCTFRSIWSSFSSNFQALNKTTGLI